MQNKRRNKKVTTFAEEKVQNRKETIVEEIIKKKFPKRIAQIKSCIKQNTSIMSHLISEKNAEN